MRRERKGQICRQMYLMFWKGTKPFGIWKKPILIEGPMMQSELNELLKTLSPRGLYVWAMIESEDDRARREK